MSSALLISGKDRWGKWIYSWLKSIYSKTAINLPIMIADPKTVSKLDENALTKYAIVFYCADLATIDEAVCKRFLLSHCIKVGLFQQIEITCLQRRYELFDHIYTPLAASARYLQYRLGSTYAHSLPDPEFMRDVVEEPSSETSSGNSEEERKECESFNPDKISVFAELANTIFPFTKEVVTDFVFRRIYILKSYELILKAMIAHRVFIAFNIDDATKTALLEYGYPQQLIIGETGIADALTMAKEQHKEIVQFMIMKHRISKLRLENVSMPKIVTAKRPTIKFATHPDEILKSIKRGEKYEDSSELVKHISELIKDDGSYLKVVEAVNNIEKLPEALFEICQNSKFGIDIDVMNSNTELAKQLAPFHKKSGVIFDTNINESFTEKSNLYTRMGILPHDAPWMGVLHNYTAEFFEKTDIILSLPTCTGIIVFSNHTATQVKEQLQKMAIILIPVFSMTYGCSTTLSSIYPWSEKAPPNCQLVTIACQGTRFHNISRLTDLVCTKENRPYERITLYMDDKFAPTPIEKLSLKRAQESNRWERSLLFNLCEEIKKTENIDILKEPYEERLDELIRKKAVTFTEGVEYRKVDKKEFGKALSECVGFLDPIEGNVTTSNLLYFVMQATPVLVHKSPAIVEYLGEDYPLYYTDLPEIATILTSEKIHDAHKHLDSVRKRFTNDLLVDQFESLFE